MKWKRSKSRLRRLYKKRRTTRRRYRPMKRMKRSVLGRKKISGVKRPISSKRQNKYRLTSYSPAVLKYIHVIRTGGSASFGSLVFTTDPAVAAPDWTWVKPSTEVASDIGVVGTSYLSLGFEIAFNVMASNLDTTSEYDNFIRLYIVKNRATNRIVPSIANLPQFFNDPIDHNYYNVLYDKVWAVDSGQLESAGSTLEHTQKGAKNFRFKIPYKMRQQLTPTGGTNQINSSQHIYIVIGRCREYGIGAGDCWTVSDMSIKFWYRDDE